MISDPATTGDSDESKIEIRRAEIHRYLEQCGSEDAIEKIMNALKMPWGQVRDPRDVAEQPSLQARKMIKQVDDRNGGMRTVSDMPYRFSNAASGISGRVSHCGEDNHEVLANWLQLDDQQIEKLMMDGVVQSGEHLMERK